jgi:hypothetical protein
MTPGQKLRYAVHIAVPDGQRLLAGLSNGACRRKAGGPVRALITAPLLRAPPLQPAKRHGHPDYARNEHGKGVRWGY